MNCPNCGGPASKGFYETTLYCKAECDLKKPIEAEAQPFGYCIVPKNIVKMGAGRWWVWKTVESAKKAISGATQKNPVGYYFWEVSGKSVAKDIISEPFLAKEVSFIKKVE